MKSVADDTTLFSVVYGINAFVNKPNNDAKHLSNC